MLATLQRYLNGRYVSFDVDNLLLAFEPFHRGIVDPNGTVPLSFPGFPSRYELRLGADAVARRVTLTLNLRLPIHAPGFWFCVHCLMSDDYVALFTPSKPGIFYANPETPRHAPSLDGRADRSLASVMTRVPFAGELVRLFTAPE